MKCKDRFTHLRMIARDGLQTDLTKQVEVYQRLQLSVSFTKYVQLLRRAGIGAIANILDSIIQVGTQDLDDLVKNRDIELICQEIDEVYPDANK